MTAEVRIVEEVADALVRASRASSPYETGGILLGLKGDGHLWVTRAVEVPPIAPQLARYVLPAGMTHELVSRARTEDERLGYLGDWHSHPADAGASGTDLQTYGRAVRYATRRRETHPLLIVVRRTESEWILEPTVMKLFGARAVAATLTVTGCAPGPETSGS